MPDAPSAHPASTRSWPGFEIRLIERDEDLVRLLPDWWSLWSRQACAAPFTSPAWLLPWWRTFRPGRLLSVAVHRHGRLVALLPAYVEDGHLGRRLLPLGIGASDYLDVLVDPMVEAAGGALAAATLGTSARWDRWKLEELAPDAAALSLPLPPSGAASRPQSACPVLTLGAASAWPRTRAGRRWARAWNRVKRHAGVVVASAAADTAPAMFDHLARLHGQRWAADGQPGVLADPTVRAFHRAAIPHLLAAGLLQLFTLAVGGRVVGAYYGLVRGRRAYGYLHGFDPDWRFDSPGTALIGHAIRTAVEAGCDEYHFLRGREPYKYAWGAVDRWNQARHVEAPPDLGPRWPPDRVAAPAPSGAEPGATGRVG